MGKIISKCSVCSVIYDEKESFSDISGVSHGYCEVCLAVEMEKVA